MTSHLFYDWLQRFDASFNEQGYKIQLWSGNCTANGSHYMFLYLNNVELYLLPPSVTSKKNLRRRHDHITLTNMQSLSNREESWSIWGGKPSLISRRWMFNVPKNALRCSWNLMDSAITLIYRRYTGLILNPTVNSLFGRDKRNTLRDALHHLCSGFTRIDIRICWFSRKRTSVSAEHLMTPYQTSFGSFRQRRGYLRLQSGRAEFTSSPYQSVAVNYLMQVTLCKLWC